jgi:adenosylhomocysteine nucleosidase
MSDGLACDRRLVELAAGAAQRAGLAYRQSASLTVPGLVGQPDLKRRIGSCLPVEAVEMESYWVGRVAEQHGIPFLALRAISDAVGERLPDLPGVVDDEGAVQAGRALPLLLRRPLYAPTLLRLARGARRAAQNLAALVEAFVNDWRAS